MYQVPTDSLYKFCAISGIILMVFSFYYPYSISKELNQDLIKFEYEVSALRIEINYAKKEAEYFIKEINNKPKVGLSQQKLADILNKITLLAKEQEIKTEKIVITQKFLENNLNLSKHFVNIGRIGSIVGTILSCWGFFMWYIKIQIHQDKLILMSSNVVPTACAVPPHNKRKKKKNK